MKMADLDLLIPTSAPEPAESKRWATVTSASPLRVRRDTETAALLVPVIDLVGGLKVGDRVWTTLHTDGQIYVTGKLNGGDTGWTTVEPAAGYTAVVAVQVRRVGDDIMWRGRITGAGLGTTGTKQLAPAANCPSWAWPSSYNHTPCPVATVPTAAIAQCMAGSTNGLEVSVGTTGMTDIWLSGLRYTY